MRRRQRGVRMLAPALFVVVAGCAAHDAPPGPATKFDDWNFYHAHRLELVDGVTTAQQVRDGMGVDPGGTYRDGRVWVYFWRVTPHWEGGFEIAHEDATDKSDRSNYTEYLFLEFDDAGILRRHLFTSNRYERDAFDNPITGPPDAARKALQEADHQRKEAVAPRPRRGKWW